MRPRPLVDLDIPLPPEEVLARFRAALADGAPVQGHVGRRELSLEVAGPERHTWSPRISLEVRESDVGTHVRGRFGPHPNVWTLFVFVYSVLVAVFIGGSVYGLVQILLEEPPTALFAAAGACVGLAASCAVDLAGRRAGRPQMTTVCRFIHATVPEALDRCAYLDDPPPDGDGTP